ncbi:MAG TPA: VTT domain-containing protein [Candidatus Acidoferrales bacterium]|jgi:membrane protein YqaA with SNARE-associated domain
MKLDPRKFAIAAAPQTKAHAVRHWFITLGGPGLILLGLLDSSIVPIPGSMDAMTIILAAHQRTWWPYYAVMATIGSVVGAYITYRLARKQGDKALHARLSQRNAKLVTETFEKWGFGAIALPALLPPPMPMVPFVIAAGALQYSPKKFLAAMTLGRILRYCILAYLGAVYGRKIFAVVLAHGEVTLAATIGLAVVVALGFLLMRFRKKRPAIANAR